MSASGSRARRVRRLWRAAAAVAVVGAGLALPTVAAAGPTMVRQADLATSVPPDGGREVGPLPASRRLSLDVVLAPSNDVALQALLRTLYTPGSPGYHRWLGRGRFAELFGPSRGEIDAVEAWLHDAGLPDTSVSGSSVRVSGSVAQVSSALGTSFAAYRADTGSTGYLAPAGPADPPVAGRWPDRRHSGARLPVGSFTGDHPEVDHDRPGPGWERPAVDGVTPCAGALAEASPGYYTLDELGAAYGRGVAAGGRPGGHGQTIGVYELATHAASDVDTYESCFGLTNPVDTDEVDGGGGAAGGGGTVEADLDIEQAATQAPGATVISYEGPDTSAGDYDVWSSMVRPTPPRCSPRAGACASHWPPTTESSGRHRPVGAGGDPGSDRVGGHRRFRIGGVLRTGPVDRRRGLLPRLGPLGHGGGWHLVVRTRRRGRLATARMTRARRARMTTGTKGPGRWPVAYESRPSYEPNLLDWPTAETCGQTAGNFRTSRPTPGSAWWSTPTGLGGVRKGTSYAAPFMAGLAADRNDGCVQPTGAWAPELYALAAEGSYGAGLTDVTSGDTDLTGSNGGAYPATAGFDAATGLGSPEAAGLSCPEVTSVGTGYEGAHVDIHGLGLEHATFTFGGTAARVLSSTATSAIVVVPEGTGSVTVRATSVLGVGTRTRRSPTAPCRSR